MTSAKAAVAPSDGGGKTGEAPAGAAPRVMRTDLDVLTLLIERKLSDAELLNVFRRMIASKPDNAAQWMTQILKRVAALFEIATVTSEVFRLEELLPQMGEVLEAAMRVERARVFLNDRAGGGLFTMVREGDETHELRPNPLPAIYRQVFDTGEGLIVNDPNTDPRFDATDDHRTGFTTRNILCVPLMKKGGVVVGIGELANKRSGAFTEDDLAFMDALTRQGATALDHAQLMEEVERVRRDESQLLEITSAFSSELQLDSLLVKIVKVTTEFLDAERSTLFLHDPPSRQLWSRVAEGASEIRIPEDSGIAGACFMNREPIHIPDCHADPRFNPEVDKKTGFTTRNMLCMPIVSKNDKVIGVMQVLNKKAGGFTTNDERKLKSFAAQAAVALLNAQLFEEVLASRNYTESILKSLTNGVVTLDTANNITRANDAAARILDLRTASLTQSSIGTVLGSKNPWVLETIRKVRASGHSEVVMDGEFVIGQDKSVSVNLTAVPLIDQKEKQIGSMLVFEDISREKRVKSTMARYMTKDIAERLLDGGDDVLGGQAVEASVVFTDIRSFTTLTEKLGPRETVQMLNEYFTDMVEVIFKNHGILDKYIGDAIMAVFGAPFPTPLDANNAVTTATQMLVALRKLNEARLRDGKLKIEMGVGINTGEVISGNIGSPKRMDYTVIGDTVNLASRLEGATKEYGAQVLISEATRFNLTDDKILREIDQIRVKGKENPVTIHEALDHHTPDTFPSMHEVIGIFGRAYEEYKARDFRKAKNHFEEALRLHPHDGPSNVYVLRCIQCILEPPPGDWDGVFVMKNK